MTNEEFKKEFNKRVDNRFLEYVHKTRITMTPEELMEWNKVPAHVLAEVHKAGAHLGLKIFSDMSKEGLLLK